MKKKGFVFLSVLVAICVSIASCDKDKDDENEVVNTNLISMPTSMTVDIPSSISRSTKSKSTKGDTLSGDEIYKNLRSFIYIGEEAASIVDDIMTFIGGYSINKPMTVNYTGENGERKILEVVETAIYDNVSYQFKLTITDSMSMQNADGGKAIQIFWNTNPVKGVTIFKPYNIDRVQEGDDSTVICKIDYSEAGENGYDKEMTVTIANRIIDANEIYDVDNLKMFVGKKGDNVDVYGNSNHPNATLIDPSNTAGFNWAFVASGDDKINIGVAEVGLPSSAKDISTRVEILDTNSITKVFANEILSVFPGAPQSLIDSYLSNASAPGYFNSTGFISAGTIPSANNTIYTTLTGRIENLTPYNPNDISNMSIVF